MSIVSIDSGIAAIIGSAVACFFSSATIIITLIINKRAERRRQIQDLAVKIATELHAGFREDYQRVNPGGVLPPHMFHAFVVHTAQVVEAVGRADHVTGETLLQGSSIIQKVYDSMEAVAECRRKVAESDAQHGNKPTADTGK